MKSDKLRLLKSYKSLLLAGIIISVIGALVVFTPSTATVSASTNLVSASPNSYAQQMDRTFKKHRILKLDRARVARQVKQTGKLSIATPEESFELDLTPHDMRAADYYAEEAVEGGTSRRLESAPVKTFRGKAHGLNEAEARFTIDEDKFEGVMINRDDFYIIEPARKYAPLADQSDFVFYKASDVEPEAEGTCAVTLDKEITQTGERVLSKGSVSNVTTGEANLISSDAVFSPNLDVELATEADFEYVTAKGSSTAANDEILNIMNQVEGVYQAQLGITFTITIAAQHTWNTASDPYTTTDAGNLLDEFTNYWNANFTTIKRDVAHLWTGKDLNGSTLGVAWVGVVCRSPSSAYGLSQLWTVTPGKFILTAHELGHNFGANHADTTAHADCGNTIMQSTVGTGFTFCQSSIDEITAFVSANSSCLSRVTTTTTKAAITSPVNGVTLSSSTVAFNWGPVSSGVSYYFDVGNTQGSRDIYGSPASGGLTTVAGLPADGRRIYVRLWTLIDGAWQFNDYSYLTTSTTTTAARITSPANGATFASSIATFTWSPVSSGVTYYLDLSSTPGSRDIFANYVTGGSSIIGGIPVDGRTVYARLWSLIGGVWSYNEYTYKAASSVVKAAITSPVNGATFASSTVTFTWSPVSGAVTYYLDLNSSPGSRDIFANYVTGGSTTISGIPVDGRTIYVRLWSLIGGAWQFNDYTYKASTSGSALISSPVNGSTFTSSTVTFTWNTVAGASQYFLDLNTSPGSRDIFANYVTGGSTTVTGIPTDGRTIYVRLWTNVGGVWAYTAYTYTAKPTP